MSPRDTETGPNQSWDECYDDRVELDYLGPDLFWVWGSVCSPEEAFNGFGSGIGNLNILAPALLLPSIQTLVRSSPTQIWDQHALDLLNSPSKIPAIVLFKIFSWIYDCEHSFSKTNVHKNLFSVWHYFDTKGSLLTGETLSLYCCLSVIECVMVGATLAWRR